MASAIGLTVFLIVLSACATTRVVEHGIAPQVKGTQTVYDIHVVYGAKELRFDGKRPPGSGGGWTGYMPIPDEMLVSWTVNDERQTTRVTLRGKWDPAEKLANWQLHFDGRNLEVWRQDDDPSSPYYRKRPVKVYP